MYCFAKFENRNLWIIMEIGSIHCALFVPMWINYDLKRTCTFKLTIFVKKIFSLIRYDNENETSCDYVL